MRGVVTVTPAAAVDLTYTLAGLELGEVNRATAVHTELSGKGVNVAHAVHLGGMPVAAVVPVGDDALAHAEAPELSGLLSVVRTGGRTRINTTLLAPGSGTTKVNESPVPLDAAVWDEVVRSALAAAVELDAEWLVVSGSVPATAGTGAPVPVGELIAAAHDTGLRVAVDTAGASLRAVVDDLGPVALLKPNTHELAELMGRPLATVGDVRAAALELHRAGCDIVYVSMGADGALGLDASGCWVARARAEVVNTAGAGDASLAGFLVGSSTAGAPDVPAGLALAASWGALAVGRGTTLLGSLEGAPRAAVTEDPDPGTPLSEPARG